MIIYANPSTRPKRAKTATKARKPRAAKKGASAMAKKHRSAAQRAATKRMLAANRHRKTTNNPAPRRAKRRYAKTTHNPVHRRRRTTRNPSIFGGGMGVLGELMTKEGLLMIGGAFVAPMTMDFVQEKIMPSATGWLKIGVKAVVVGAGAWAIDKFLKQPKAALAFGVTGSAVLAADAIRLYRGQLAGLSDAEADYLATKPELMQAYVNAGAHMGDPYRTGLADPYRVGLGGAFEQAFG